MPQAGVYTCTWAWQLIPQEMPGIMLNQRSYTEEVWESAEGFLCIV